MRRWLNLSFFLYNFNFSYKLKWQNYSTFNEIELKIGTNDINSFGRIVRCWVGLENNLIEHPFWIRDKADSKIWEFLLLDYIQGYLQLVASIIISQIFN